MVLNDDQVILVTQDGTNKLSTNQLSWRNSTQFRISGLHQQPSRRPVTIRFRTQIEAERAASAVIQMGRALEPLAFQSLEEIQVELPATVMLSGSLLGGIGIGVLLFAGLLTTEYSVVLHSVFDVAFFVLAFAIIWRLLNKRVKAGPAVAWFHPRKIRAWLSFDESELVIRFSGYRRIYSPSRIGRIDDKSLMVAEGETILRIVFQDSDIASRVASKLTSNLTT